MVAGHPALDFVNTVEGRFGADAVDRVHTYAQLLEWAQQAGLLTPTDARGLANMEAQDPGGADRALRRATRFREALYSTVSAVATGSPAPSEPLAAVNEELAVVAPQLHVKWAQVDGQFALAHDDPSGLSAPLSAVVWSAVNLVTSDALLRIRECEVPACRWLFLDGTRNHSRRWCDAATCGNRERVRRHYRRRRAAE